MDEFVVFALIKTGVKIALRKKDVINFKEDKFEELDCVKVNYLENNDEQWIKVKETFSECMDKFI